MKCSIPARKGCLVLILSCHGDLVVGIGEVNFGENLGTIKLGSELINSGEGIWIQHGVRVELPVINTHPKLTILLFSKEDRCSIGWIGHTNLVGLQQMVNLLAKFCQLIIIKGIQFSLGRLCCWINKINLVLKQAVQFLTSIHWVHRRCKYWRKSFTKMLNCCFCLLFKGAMLVT